MDEQTGAGTRVAWRELDPHLWVAIGPDGHMGTIELGRRYVVVDTHGEVRGRCRSLDHAMAVLIAVGDHSRRHPEGDVA